MVSKSIKFSILFFGVFALNACVNRLGPDKGNENIVGNKLENIAPLKASDGSEKNKIVIFDETIRKVHEFDLSNMSNPRSFSVLNPDEKHYVLNDQVGNYVIDFSLKHISIFDNNSNLQHNPVTFLGKPVSAAFRPELGLLVMYDDLKNVSILKLLPDGHVNQAKVFGSVFNFQDAITSGDLLADGRLVFSLSDDSLVIVNIDQSLAQSQFVYTKQNTTLDTISWLAPVPNKPDLIFIKTRQEVALYNLATASVVSTVSIAPNSIEKLSKSSYPHMIERIDYDTVRLIYTDGLAIRAVKLDNQSDSILNSELDLSTQTWTIVNLYSYVGSSLFNDVNQVRERRTLRQYRVSDMLALQNKALPDEAQIKLGSDYFFALYPSELGYAEKTSIQSAQTKVIKQFNLKKF